jgi:hypothetical protein
MECGVEKPRSPTAITASDMPPDRLRVAGRTALIPGGGEKPRSSWAITASNVPPDLLRVAGPTTTVSWEDQMMVNAQKPTHAEQGLTAVVCTPFMAAKRSISSSAIPSLDG